MKKYFSKSLFIITEVLLTLSMILCIAVTVYAVPEEYFFEELSFDSNNGFKTVDNRFLVSEEFYSNSGIWIYYGEGDSYVSGVIIKPDGENLASFDLIDMEFGPNEGIEETGLVNIEIEAILNTGSSMTRSVTGDLSSIESDTLTEMGMDMSPFDNVTQLSFSIGTLESDVDVWDILFESITIDDENAPPEMVVRGNGSIIVDGDTSPRAGDSTDFGSSDIATGSVTKTFSIRNTGSGRLTLTAASPHVVLTGDSSDFSLFTAPAGVIAAGASTIFTIRFNPVTTGTRIASVNIANDDADENPYNFNIRGTGYEKAKVLNLTSTIADNTYGGGDVIDITVEFDKEVTINGTPQLALETGATDAVASYISGSGTDTLTFRYNVASFHRNPDLSYKGTDALLLNGGAIRDSDGYDALLVLPGVGDLGSLSYNKNLYIITPGFSITESGSGTVVGESGLTDTFTVVLTAQPDSDVVINISCDDLTETVVDLSVLTFTRNTWNTAQTVTVMGINDSGDDGNISSTINLSVDDGASDDNFDNLSDKMITVITEDNDSAGFVIDETSENTIVNESGTEDTFSVVLTAQPVSDVVINIVSGDVSEAIANSSGLTFTNDNWDIAQIVTIIGIDDRVFDGMQSSIITLSVNDGASDNSFDLLEDQTVDVTTTDDDVDTDNDGMSDDWENTHGLDPNSPDDEEADNDGDGLSNHDEYQYDTNPNEEDSDGDGLSDQWEIENGYDPTITDSDANETDDGEEDPDNDGVNNIFEELLGMEPDNIDSDGNGIEDGDEDPDGDGIKTIEEIDRGLNPGVNELPTVVIAQPEQTINENVEVTIDGSGSSDVDDGVSTYLWTQITGLDTIITIINADKAVATFISPQVDQGGESFEFNLTVKDSADQRSSSTCIVNVTWSNMPPVANAGEDQEVNAGDMVQLDCSASIDSDGEIVSYFWEQIDGTEVEAFDSTSVNPFFTAPYTENDEMLVFRLTITDQEGLESMDLIEIKVLNLSVGGTAENSGSDSSGGGLSCFIKSAE